MDIKLEISGQPSTGTENFNQSQYAQSRLNTKYQQLPQHYEFKWFHSIKKDEFNY